MAGVVSGMPAFIAITRDRYMSRGSVLITWPMTTWPICAPSTPARAKAAFAAWVAMSMGGSAASEPPKPPMAVRAAERMWMSVMGASGVCGSVHDPAGFAEGTWRHGQH